MTTITPRADSIVKDAEMVRKTLVSKESFSGRYLMDQGWSNVLNPYRK